MENLNIAEMSRDELVRLVLKRFDQDLSPDVCGTLTIL